MLNLMKVCGIIWSSSDNKTLGVNFHDLKSNTIFKSFVKNLIQKQQKPGYARTKPSGTLPFALISFIVKAQTKFPPAESPIKITFFGSISTKNFSLSLFLVN